MSSPRYELCSTKYASGLTTAQGYGPANLVALLHTLRGNLQGLDLSGLSLRNAYLQGVEMQDASLAGAQVQNCVFTETFEALTGVAISSKGDYWAAASRRGEIRIWIADGQIIRRMWHAHANMIYHLAFSPDGRTLASGGWDGILKLWDMESGALLWFGTHASHINNVAFSPDGTLLTTSSDDATLRVWDRQTGHVLHELAHSHSGNRRWGDLESGWSPVRERRPARRHSLMAVNRR